LEKEKTFGKGDNRRFHRRREPGHRPHREWEKEPSPQGERILPLAGREGKRRTIKREGPDGDNFTIDGYGRRFRPTNSFELIKKTNGWGKRK